jgi:hypothetical protein
MPSPNLARAARKIEELPTDDGSVLDCLAGRPDDEALRQAVALMG